MREIAGPREPCVRLVPAAHARALFVAGPFGPPKIMEPLFDCSRGIPIAGAHPGALVQAFDGAGTPLSDPASITQASMLLTPWFPLAAGRKVQVRQSGHRGEPVGGHSTLPRSSSLATTAET